MNIFFHANSSIAIALFIILLASVPAEQGLGNLVAVGISKTAKKGPFIDGARFIQYLDDNTALQEMKRGGIDTYYFRVPLEVVSDLKQNAGLSVYNRMAGSFGLLLNPAPPKDNDTLNPFYFRAIRYAANYLINREFVVDEILKGYGTPMVDPFGIYSPEYPNIISSIESLGIRYNPVLAEKIITSTLDSAGASKQAGKWTFKGNPIVVKVLIRSDDSERRSMGELISSELQKIGFTVIKDYGDLNKANTLVYGSDPQDFQWNVYTEAYAGTSAFVKYNPSIPSQMYAPYAGNMPGGQNPSFWHYQNSSIDKLTQRIAFFNFTSANERNSLVRNATLQGIQESVRIFVAQLIEPYVATSSLKGLINDFGAGITSKYSLSNVRTPKLTNSLDIGVKQIYQGAWNNIAGCKDAYCSEIFTQLADSATFRNPYTGEVIPMRELWTNITTLGPHHKIHVPDDVRIWDPAIQKWRGLGKNDSAISKVTFKMLLSKWHNGIAMDRADILYPLYFTFEWGTNSGNGDKTYDPEYGAAAQVALPLIKGIKFDSNNTIESYIDQWHYDKKEIADSAAIWPSEPWEITAATERLVTAGKFAFSKGEASAKNIDWLSLIVPSHADAIKSELQKMKDEKYIPNPLKGIVSVTEAQKRYQASINWINTHRNAVISNGPFYLDSYNPQGGIIIIKAFRDSSYPFEQGHWSVYEHPKIITLEKIQVPQFAVIGKPLKILVNASENGKPTTDAIVNYFISDWSGKVILSGVAQPPSKLRSHEITSNKVENSYVIDLNANATAKLRFGPNLIKIFATGKDAFRPDIYGKTILAIRGKP
ncbi:MAG TPA: ABC transporter substrate-binding protein [Nitrososphaeraceae archaeon]